MAKAHYIYGNGSYGCLYDSGPSWTYRYRDAVTALADTFDLDEARTEALRDNGYLDLNPKWDGADYCEITSCDCATPSDHGEE